MVIAYGQKGFKPISYSTYYLNRAARIYPIYLLALIAMIAVGFHGSIMGINFKAFFLQASLLHAWVPPYPLTLNYPAWSLSVEAFFYLSFPLLFNKVFTKYGLKPIAITVSLIFIISQAVLYFLRHSSFYHGFPSPSHDLINYFPLSHFPAFLLGNCLGMWFINIPNRYYKNYDLAVVAIFIPIAYIMVTKQAMYVLPVLFVIIILLLSLNKTGYITKVFSAKTLQVLGEASYGVYILQAPVFNLVIRLNSKVKLFESTGIFYAGCIVLLIVSIISYFLIEVPLRDYIKSIYNARKTQKATPAVS
jgi:peptidoglycan/LPS O-acetylase OafA/YrhL